MAVKRLDKFKGGFRGLKSMMTRRRPPSQVGKAFGTKRRERYLVGVTGNTGSYTYTSKFSTAKAKGAKLAEQYGKAGFFIQNQVTGSIVNFSTNPTFSLPRNRWISGSIRITKSGKIQMKRH